MQGEKGSNDYELPELTKLSKEEFEKYLPIYHLWIITEKRIPLSVLMNEPQEAWSAILEIHNYFLAIKEMKRAENAS